MRTPRRIFLLLLLGAGTTAESSATRTFEASSRSRSRVNYEAARQINNNEKAKSFKNQYSDDGDSSVVVVAPVEPGIQHKEGMQYRRPSVDAGLRYSSNDWLGYVHTRNLFFVFFLVLCRYTSQHTDFTAFRPTFSTSQYDHGLLFVERSISNPAPF